MFKFVKQNGGFSLIEGVLAIAVISIGLVVGLSALQSSVTANIYIEQNQTATALAKEKIEIILADKEYLGLSYIQDPLNYPVETLAGIYNGYTRTVTITEVAEADLKTPATNTGLYLIEVTVGWNIDDEITLTTVVADLS